MTDTILFCTAFGIKNKWLVRVKDRYLLTTAGKKFESSQFGQDIKSKAGLHAAVLATDEVHYKLLGLHGI